MMLNVAAEIIMSEDLEGNITMLNDSGYKNLGYEAPELIGKNYIETFLPREIRAEMSAYYSKRKSDDQSSVDTHENSVISKSGTVKNLLAKCHHQGQAWSAFRVSEFRAGCNRAQACRIGSPG
jgi:PAS domain S-box-containing protein